MTKPTARPILRQTKTPTQTCPRKRKPCFVGVKIQNIIFYHFYLKRIILSELPRLSG
ncbi:hypothetical protein QUF58_11610 [Anaerolineales bacterium HSG24]|nr:hypothetical protein [Anaerolineales bacterium HSG24]